ncbi:MarR family transcriptional regulator [Arthrobacter sp. H5]|uniref:MarR family winged helix-turn-helix transcriptional regulator n=1 Tax=Arthrobacter sp. H5 TaxID=1267973 RepID=UPI0004838819|nr:MarR family transcriptional regulator [Arthrobacter sp. H5]
MTDHVDRIIAQWNAERPDVDVSPMAVIGRLSRVTRKVTRELDTVFADHHLDAASFDVLATLRRSGKPFELSPRDLAQSSMVTSSAVAQRLNRLEERHLITRSKNHTDGRSIQVTLTPEGRRLIDAALPAHVNNEARLLSALTDAERSTLAALLRKLDTLLPD